MACTPAAPLPLAPLWPLLLDELVIVVFFLVVEVMALFEEVTFSFLVLEDELEPLGVFRTTTVDLVPMPAVM